MEYYIEYTHRDGKKSREYYDSEEEAMGQMRAAVSCGMACWYGWDDITIMYLGGVGVFESATLGSHEDTRYDYEDTDDEWIEAEAYDEWLDSLDELNRLD